MKKTKKITSIIVQIITCILFFFLLIAIYGKVQMLVLKRSYSSYFGYTMFQIASASMEPELSINDVVVVKIGADYKIKDVISFQDGKDIITHRVIGMNGDKIIVQGDNNNAVDAPIDKSAVIGKVVKVYPELKVWQDIFTDPKILGFLFLTILLFDLALSKKKDEKSEKDEGIVNKTKKVIKKDKTKKVVKKLPEKKQPKETKNDLKRIEELKKQIKIEQITDESINRLTEEEIEKFTMTLSRDEIEEFLIREEVPEDADPEDYTVRLDLKKIQKEIAKRVK